MFSKISDKLLGLSGSYTFYKSEYARLNEKCELLERDNASLRDDVRNLLEKLNDKQDTLLENCDTSELSRENADLKKDIISLLEKLNDKQDTVIANCNTSNLSEDNAKILDALMSNQYHFTNKFNENKALLESLEDSCMRVEKTSSYTNLKLDSKFDDNRRFLVDEILSRLK